MLLKPLMLGISIDFGLLAIALTLRFIIYPIYMWHQERKEDVGLKEIIEAADLEKTIEIRIEEIDSSDHYKHYLKI